MRRLAPLFALLGASLDVAAGARGDAASAAARAWRQHNERAILAELVELSSIPNHASDRDGIARNAALLVGMLERRGLAARLLPGPQGAPPAVFAERDFGRARTVVFYAHYDGQPVNRAEWRTEPFAPTLYDRPLDEGGKPLPLDAVVPPFAGEWRLYARSVSDDRAPIVALLAALDALAHHGIAPSVNLKVFLEGEEEAGSPHLGELLRRHREALRADLWLFGDGPVHQTRRQQVVFGARGVMGLEITLLGPRRALHSGHYGNWAPNPAARLAELLASLRDGDGRIKIEGFYDDVRAPSPADRSAIAALPPVEDALRRELLLGGSEGGGAPLAERVMLPALNVQGLRAGEVGALARNAIPTDATVAIDLRLVPDQRPARVRDLVVRHLRQQGYEVIDLSGAPPASAEPGAAAAVRDEERLRHPRLAVVRFEGGYPAYRLPLDHPAAVAVLAVADQAAGAPVLRAPLLGGSLPLYLFDEILGAPLVTVPIVNHDNNQHAPDENLRLQNLWDGIELYAALVARLGERW